MKKRLLGKTGLQVSELAFGGVEIGMPYGIGVTGEKDMLPEAEAIYLLHAAIDAGVNFFDTARLYGQSESIMGKAFGGRREQLVISTKCRHFRDRDGSIPSYPALERMITASLNESLAALGTEYIDVFMLHQADLDILENEEVASIFASLKRSGVIRATGVSTYTPAETKKAMDTGAWDVIQLPFNLLDQRQEACFAEASEKGIGIMVRSVLLKGLLSNRGKGLHPALKKVEDHIGRYHALVGTSFTGLPAFATKFALSFPEISSVLVGIDRVEYLHQSLAAVDGRYLDEKTMLQAKELAYPAPDFLNLAQWSKNGWLA